MCIRVQVHYRVFVCMSVCVCVRWRVGVCVYFSVVRERVYVVVGVCVFVWVGA